MSQIFGTNLLKIFSNHNKIWTRQYASKKKKKSPVIILRAGMGEASQIRKLFVKSFFPYEPLSIAMGVKQHHGEIISHFISKELIYGHSFMAMDRKTGKIASCCVNKVHNKNVASELLHLSKLNHHPPIHHTMEFLAYVYSVANLHEKFKSKEFFEMAFIATDQEYRGKGLGLQLLRESLKLGHQKGYPVCVIASNVVTTKMCQKLKMKQIMDVPYDLYKGADGKPIMNIQYPDVSCQIFVHLCPK